MVDQSGWNAIYDRIAKKILDGNIEDVPSDLYFKTAGILMDAVYQGLGATQFEYDDQRAVLGAHLQHNIYAFSAAKSFTQLLYFQDAMLDEEGKIRSYASYRKKIADAGLLFNDRFLNTEFNTAQQSAIMAHKWEVLDTEYLEFSTVGDDRVRPEHAVLDKFTALKSDPVWKKIYPPLAFNCRCTVIPGKKVNNEKKMTAIEAAKAINPHIKNTPFDNNVGLSRLVFNDNHPYFKNVDGEVKNLSWQQYGLRSLDQIKTNKLPEYPKTSLQEYYDWWEKQKKHTGDDFILRDVLGQDILFPSHEGKKRKSYDLFKEHILKKQKENRFEYGTEATNIIKDPDEIWFNTLDDNSRFYIKYYEQATLKLVVNEKMEAVTLYDIKEQNTGELNRTRKGVLLFKK
ncbi:minor capsid protein [Flavobacterium sp. TN-1]